MQICILFFVAMNAIVIHEDVTYMEPKEILEVKHRHPLCRRLQLAQPNKRKEIFKNLPQMFIHEFISRCLNIQLIDEN